MEQKRDVCVARAARLSYQNFDKKVNIEDDIALTRKLAESDHYSPFEHVATPLPDGEASSSNFHGWRQYRKYFVAENKPVDLVALMQELKREEMQLILPFAMEEQ
jgi:hypothetical protein